MNSVFNRVTTGLLVLLLFMGVALAEHEADHRYTINGYVLDKNDKGIAGSDVKIKLSGKLLAQKTTDSSGYYKAKLHLHDPDYGKDLEIITDAGQGKVKIEFTLGDKETERFHQINFVAGTLVEGKLTQKSVPQWMYIAAGVILVLVIVIAVGSNSRSKSRSKKSKDKKSNKNK